MGTLSVALAGNPNTGKTTIFNKLTGARQKIGNWPGVTVDKKVGYMNHKDRAISVIDLPGAYSIAAQSPEESVMIDYLLNERPDVVVNVLDAANLARNLFLTVQLLEYGIPVILNLNMMDEAQKRGIIIRTKVLEEQLGMPVVETLARDVQSVQRLLDVFTDQTLNTYQNSELVTRHIALIQTIAANTPDKLDAEEAIIAARYALIDEILAKVVTVKSANQGAAEKIDRVLASGWVALPVLLAMIYLVFEITFTWLGQPMADFVEMFIGDILTPWLANNLAAMGVAAWLESLILEGIVVGVGGVLTFVPLIFTLFFCLSLLDGTGYMARVAFITDPIMRRAGLTGKGIMPMIMGFGCAVPAIMGAKALDSAKDRNIAILVTPFLTCGAKLPVMALFAALFFPEQAANVVFSIYLAGVVVAIVMAKLLSKSVFKETESSFILELPPYRIPQLPSLLLETWEKGKGFLLKAGTIIFSMSILIWGLSNYNLSGVVPMEESFLAVIGGVVAKLFVFHGFATWEAGAAVITGILAKEAVVSTLGIVYGITAISEDVAIAAGQMQNTVGMSFSALSAYSFMVFLALYTPCMTALGTIKKEMGSWKWLLFSASYTFVVAWVISLLIYQIGKMFAIGL